MLLGVAITPEIDIAAKNQKQLHLGPCSSQITKFSAHFHIVEQLLLSDVSGRRFMPEIEI